MLLFLTILACLMAEPGSTCGGHRKEFIPYFLTCTFIFMYMQTGILFPDLCLVVLFGFCGVFLLFWGFFKG